MTKWSGRSFPVALNELVEFDNLATIDADPVSPRT